MEFADTQDGFARYEVPSIGTSIAPSSIPRDISKELGECPDVFQGMRPDTIIRHAEAVIHVVMDHLPFGRDQAALYRQELLRSVEAGLPFLQHRDHMAQVTLGPLEPFDDVGVGRVFVSVRHCSSYPGILEARISWATLIAVRWWERKVPDRAQNAQSGGQTQAIPATWTDLKLLCRQYNPTWGIGCQSNMIREGSIR